MNANATGLAVLRDEAGRPYGQLEIATGRLLTMTGAFTGTVLAQHGPRGQDAYPEDGDCLMSDFAARFDASCRARELGKPSITMRDGKGPGVQVNMDLGVGDVHIPAAMPNYAAGYKLADGCADIAMPVIPSVKQSDKYFTWDSANAFKRVIPNVSSPGAGVGEVNPTLSNSLFSTVEYALASFVTTEVEANADAPLRPYQAGVIRVMNALRLEREIRVANLLTTSGSWNSANVQALASGAQWNNGASSDPVANMQTAEENSFMPITRWIFPQPVYHAFVRNPAVKSYWAFKDDPATTTIPSPENLSTLLRVAPIVVAKMKYSSGGSPTYVWPSAAGTSSAVVGIHEPPQNPPTSQEDVATAYTFRWTNAPAPDGTTTAGFLVRSYYDPRRGARGGRYIVVVHNDTEVMTSTIVGGLISAVIR